MSKEKISQGNLDRAMEGTSGNRVFCSMAKTINMGNYESIRVEYGQSIVVADGQDFADAKKRVKEEVMTELVEMIEIFAGESDESKGTSGSD